MCVTCLQPHPRRAQVRRVGLFGESLQLGAVQRAQQLPRLLEPLPLLGKDVTPTAAGCGASSAAAVGVVEQGGPSAVQMEESGVVSQRKPFRSHNASARSPLQVVERLGERRAPSPSTPTRLRRRRAAALSATRCRVGRGLGVEQVGQGERLAVDGGHRDRPAVLVGERELVVADPASRCVSSFAAASASASRRGAPPAPPSRAPLRSRFRCDARRRRVVRHAERGERRIGERSRRRACRG